MLPVDGSAVGDGMVLQDPFSMGWQWLKCAELLCPRAHAHTHDARPSDANPRDCGSAADVAVLFVADT
eukprot:2924960-Prymnesium_polylepis.1